jgi:hypothetical protein
MSFARFLSGEQEVRNQETPRWFGLLRDSKALAWPAVAVLLGAIFHFVGYAADNGKTAALGIYSLDRPAISQEYVITGVVTLATLGLQVVLIVVVATGLRALARWIVHFLSAGVQTRLGAISKRAWGWMVFIAAVATALSGSSIIKDLVRGADAMILKPANEVGTAWMRMSLDQDRAWQVGYQLLLAATATIFVILSRLILTKFFTSKTARAIYGTWAMIQVFNLVAGYAFIYGAAFTFQPYPIVAFSNMEQLLGKNVIPVLIGSDDKVYAFLLVFTGGGRNETPNPGKTILYLPRPEVKWLTVVRQEPLHMIAHYHDLKTLLPAAPTNPEPASPEVPTRNTPPTAPEKSTPPG